MGFAVSIMPALQWRVFLKYLLFCALVLLTGCSLVFTKPTVTYRELKLVDIDSKGMSLDLLLTVDNPNSYDITLDGYKYRFTILDLPLGKGEKKEIVQFTGKKSTDIQVPVRITYGDALGIIMKLPNPTSIPYQLEAGLDISTPVGTLTFPIATSGVIAVPKDKLKSQMLKSIGEKFGIK
jgi:LEA14-like dessication related protein